MNWSIQCVPLMNPERLPAELGEDQAVDDHRTDTEPRRQALLRRQIRSRRHKRRRRRSKAGSPWLLPGIAIFWWPCARRPGAAWQCLQRGAHSPRHEVAADCLKARCRLGRDWSLLIPCRATPVPRGSRILVTPQARALGFRFYLREGIAPCQWGVAKKWHIQRRALRPSSSNGQ